MLCKRVPAKLCQSASVKFAKPGSPGARANVHVLRPRDGKVLGELPTDLVPDRVHVDERGWVYVAEESGHVAAYAPAPTLRLIPGGG